LIVKRSSLGDIVHAMPVACALRDTYPEAHIAWLVETRFSEVLENHPALDEVISIERHKIKETGPLLRESWRVRGELVKRHFDWALDLQGLLKSAHLQLLSRAPRRVTLANKRRKFFHWMSNEHVPCQGEKHAVERYLEMAHYLGCNIDNPRFDIPVNPQARSWAEALLAEVGFNNTLPIVGINPGASTARKQWPSERFAAAANLLDDINWVILGGPCEVGLAHEVADAIEAPTVVTAGRTDIKKLVAVINSLDVFISGDCGPLHIAAGLGIPTVGIFGPTNPALTGPFGDTHKVICHPQECSFCNRRSGKCDFKCMLTIIPEEIAAAAEEILAYLQGPRSVR